MLKSAIDGDANLCLPFSFYGRPVNTPQLAASILLKRFENDA